MSFPRYPRYKPSGVEWLGEVPEHWSVTRLKRVCASMPSNVDKKSYDDEEPVRLCNYTDVYYNDRITSSLDFMRATATRDQIERFTLRAGDTIITKDSETADDIAVAAYVPDDLPGVVCGYHLSLQRPHRHAVGAFLKWWFGSRFAKSCFAVRANGLTRVGLGQHVLENTEIAAPPIPEQRAIAAFLDRETAKIDALIAEQEKLIELLAEKRQAVISHAVTKGLNPAAPMKPSGVEWLGDVPAHWRSTRLKYAARQIFDCPHETPTYAADGAHPVVRTSDIESGRLDESAMYRVDLREYSTRTRRSALLQDDIVYSREGERWGHAALIPNSDHYCLGQRMMQFRAASAFSPVFLMWQVNARNVYTQGEVDTVGATSPHVNVSTIRNYRLTEPPLDEQRAIAGCLIERTAQMDVLSAQVRRAIELLQERRSALISAAVTGQIDVRNAVPETAA